MRRRNQFMQDAMENLEALDELHVIIHRLMIGGVLIMFVLFQLIMLMMGT
jgi:hypothetical protein